MTAPESVRVRLRYADLDTFVERFAPNVTRGGIFLASRTPRPVGEVFPFEVQLASGQVALSGAGKVIWVKPYDAAEPQKPHGMGVQFVRIDPASRETLNRMLKSRGVAPPGGGPRSPSQPVMPLASAAGPSRGAPYANGTAAVRAAHAGRPAAVIDTSVDLAAEFGLEESALRRAAVDGRWLAGNRDADQELDDLLRPEPAETITLAQAMAELPRLLDPSVRRRTGAFRTLEMLGMSGPAGAATAAGAEVKAAPGDSPANGTENAQARQAPDASGGDEGGGSNGAGGNTHED